MLQKFNKQHLNPVSTPSEPSVKLEKNKNQATTEDINYF
jgi:hypothetical protein